MEPYSITAAEQYPLNSSDDWLRKRQGLALPVLPPTTSEARKYFFSKIREFSAAACADGKRNVNFEAFAKEWNQTADGKRRFYITVEVLLAYAKSWEKLSNVRASQELIADRMQSLVQSKQIFLAEEQSFPTFITSIPVHTQPSRGVLNLQEHVPPSSLSTDLAISRPLPPPCPTLPAASHMAPMAGSPQSVDGLQESAGDSTPPAESTGDEPGNISMSVSSRLEYIMYLPYIT
jgi:hypothetical protein